MKRLLALTLVLTLVIALAIPGVAMAKRGGVPANGKGHNAAVAPAGDSNDDPADVKGKGKGKDKSGITDDDSTESPEADDQDASEGDEAAAPEKLTGIENALSRLQRNLERKQLQFAEGLRDALPAGLQATIAKFMSWLGIEPTDGTVDGEGSQETSPTVEPQLPDDTIDEGAPAL